MRVALSIVPWQNLIYFYVVFLTFCFINIYYHDEIHQLKKLGVNGKKSVVYFYGADDAPSCKKQNSAFDSRIEEFKKAGVTVVGVRNEKGVKNTSELVQNLMVDEDDAIRNQIGIKKDLFGLLGGRETYVIGKKGNVEYKFNDQFKPEAHVENTIEYLNQ